MALPKHLKRLLDFKPRGPSTQYLKTLAPKTIPLMIFGTNVFSYWVLGSSGFQRKRRGSSSRETPLCLEGFD